MMMYYKTIDYYFRKQLLLNDHEWNIQAKRFEPVKGVELYGNYMSKSGCLGQTYR